MSEPGAFDPSKLLEQARELTDRMKRVQEELRRRTVDATVGGGMVRAEVNGQLELVRIEIDPRAVDSRDVEMLQDLVVAAVNQALKRAREMAQAELQRVTGPLGAILGGSGRTP